MNKIVNRNQSIELLRIISMCMIIVLHFFAYSNVAQNVTLFSTGYFTKILIQSICNVAVNCYILISGYFCIQSRFKLKKLAVLFLQVWFYSVIFYFLAVYFDFTTFSIKDLLFSMFPTLTRQYWFVTTYVGAYLLSPIIRNITLKIDQKTHFMLLGTGFILFVVYYNFFFFCDNLNFGGATGIVWFIYLYFWGSYLARYYIPDYKKIHIIHYLSIVLLAILSHVPFYLIYFLTGNELFLQGAGIFNSVYNSIFVFISSILFFIIFLNIKLNLKSFLYRIVMSLSAVSFSVYLIHENPYVRNILWKSFDFSQITSPLEIVFYCMSITGGIYTLCWGIDVIRKIIFLKYIERKKIQTKIKAHVSD